MESGLEDLRGPVVHPFREVRGGCRDLHVMVSAKKELAWPRFLETAVKYPEHNCASRVNPVCYRALLTVTYCDQQCSAELCIDMQSCVVAVQYHGVKLGGRSSNSRQSQLNRGLRSPHYINEKNYLI